MALLALLVGAGAGITAAWADPGDLIVLRQINPRIAYRGVPHDSYPIAASVQTFPAQPFDAAIGSLSTATDAELSTRGSLGLVGTNVTGPVQLVTMGLLVGNGANGGLTPGASVGGGFVGPVAGATGGLATMIPGAIDQALAPLSMMGAAGGAK